MSYEKTRNSLFRSGIAMGLSAVMLAGCSGAGITPSGQSAANVKLSTQNYERTPTGANITQVVPRKQFVFNGESQYTLLSNLISSNPVASNVAANYAGAVMDSAGYVGNNSPNCYTMLPASSCTGGYPDFIADTQRSAFNNMIAGILTHKDSQVYQGLQALEVTYAHQTPDGDFAGTGVRAGNGSQYRGSASMHFFLAWSGEAINLLLQSPYASKLAPGGSVTYAQRIKNLTPQIRLALQYLATHTTFQTNATQTSDPLWGDFFCPARSIIDADAFAFGSLILQNDFPTQAQVFHNYALWWLRNTFISSADPNFGGRPLIDVNAGIFEEGNSIDGFGYDTSYGGVAYAQLSFYAYNFPNDLPSIGVDPYKFFHLAGRWLEQRVCVKDPLKRTSQLIIDDSDNTRTGPIPQNPEDKPTVFDLGSMGMAMLFHAARFGAIAGGTDTLDDEGLNNISKYTPTAPCGLVYGRPPFFYNTQTSVTIPVNQAIPDYILYASNTGIQTGGVQTFDPQFKALIHGLPPGLRFKGPGMYPLPANRGLHPYKYLNQSIGMMYISGTPTNTGSYLVTITPSNSYGTGATFTLNVNVTNQNEQQSYSRRVMKSV